MKSRPKPDDWFACPVCGERVRHGALACPGCGSDDRTGWSADAEYDGVDLPDDDAPAGKAWVHPENAPSPRRPRTGAWIALTAAILLAIFLLFELLPLF